MVVVFCVSEKKIGGSLIRLYLIVVNLRGSDGVVVCFERSVVHLSLIRGRRRECNAWKELSLIRGGPR